MIRGIFSALMVAMSLLIAGCALPGVSVEQTDVCARPAEQTRLLRNEDLGYCFLYPDIYTEVERENGALLVVDSMLNHSEPRLEIVVEDGVGRSATEVAAALIGELPPATVTEQSNLLLDGETALVVDGVPGQELSRLVFVVVDGRLYRFMFTHASPDLGASYTQMENLYTVVTNSFHFLRG